MAFRDGMQNVLGGFQYVQEQQERGEEKRRVGGLRALAGDYYGQQSPMLGKIARLGGDAGGMQKDMQAQGMQKAKFYAGLLLNTPKEMRGQVWDSQIAPGLNAAGLPVEGPYQDEYESFAQQLVGGEPSKPMSLSPGAQVWDPATRSVLHSNENFAPQRATWDSVRGAWIEPPTMGGMGSGGPQMPAPGGAPAAPQGAVPAMQLASLFKSFGGQLTSGYRDPAKNAAVGGVANSQHMRGTGMDFVFPSPAIKAEAMKFAKANGYDAIDEGDHVHFELPGGGAPQGGPRAIVPDGLPARPDAAGGPSKPPAGYRWNPDGSLAPIPGGPAQNSLDAKAAALEAKRTAGQVRQAEAAGQASGLVSAIDRLIGSSGFGDLGTTWGDVERNVPLIRTDAKDADAQLKNIAGQVALTTMSRLKALSATGATGFGSLTAPELRLLENSLASLQAENISNQELRASLKIIRDSMQKVADWKGPAANSAPAPQQGNASGWSIQAIP